MPTGPKLLASVLLAALAWVVSGFVVAELPDGSQVGLLAIINALVGFVIGWRVLGAQAGQGIVTAFSFGLTSVVVMTFWCILIWASHEMAELAFQRTYETPVEALIGLADLMIEYASLIVTPMIIGVLVLGGVIAAMLTEISSHYWS